MSPNIIYRPKHRPKPVSDPREVPGGAGNGLVAVAVTTEIMVAFDDARVSDQERRANGQGRCQGGPLVSAWAIPRFSAFPEWDIFDCHKWDIRLPLKVMGGVSSFSESALRRSFPG